MKNDTNEIINQTFRFKTKNCEYIFDNTSSSVVPFTDIDYNSLINILENNKEEVSSENLQYITNLINCGMFATKSKQNINDIKEKMFSSHICQLLLIITNDCNMRCEYCIMGKHYWKDPLYNKNCMSYDTAIKAINQFYNLTEEKKQRGLTNAPIISFYGGEPLVNFNLIKFVINYCKDKKYDFAYGITTNGVLLLGGIAEFLAKNDFHITVSLDGSKEEMDRKRLSINGRSVYNTVVNNCYKYIELTHKILSKSTLTFNACYDPKTDPIEVFKFFTTYFPNNDVMFNAISNNNTSYYSQFNAINYETFNLKMKYLEDKFLNDSLINCKESSFDKINFFLFYKILKKHPKFGNFAISLSCLPSNKLSVSPDGKFYMCEKMCYSLPIGDVDTGFNYCKIQELVNDYFSILSKHCVHCHFSSICNICVAHINDIKNERLVFNEDFCKTQIQLLSNTLLRSYSILEENPKAFDLIRDVISY